MTPQGQRLVLLIGADSGERRMIASAVGRAGWRAVPASDAETAIATLGTQPGMMLDAVLLDEQAPGGEPAALIAELRARRPALPILLLTSAPSGRGAVEAMRSGARDFLARPIGADRLLAALDAAVAAGAPGGELRPLTEKLSEPLGFTEIVGSEPAFRAALAVAAKAARARVPVLIEGETGTGKEVVAGAIHAASPRGKRPLVTVDCAAIPANLIDSELFGHERGAFAGAFERRIGKLVAAEGGTVLLEAVEALPLETQGTLVRALEVNEVRPQGAKRASEIDVRVIAATGAPLGELVRQGRFREDLFYRLGVVQLALPPLRARRDDVPQLARHLLARIARQPGMRELGISEDALALLMAYDWPGNVRQLQNALFRAAALCDGDALTRADFPQLGTRLLPPRPYQPRGAERARSVNGGGVALYLPDGHLRPLDEIEADVIRLAIGHYRGRMTEVARRLGIGRSTLYRKLVELGISEAA